MIGETFDFAPAYRAEGYGGIAWRAYALETETVGDWTYLGEDDDDPDDETLYVWDEDERETGRILAHMIGDDRTFTFDPDELSPIADEDYCSGCGQIGCGWGH